MFFPRYDYSKGRVRSAGGRRVAAMSTSTNYRKKMRSKLRKAGLDSGGIGGIMGAGGGSMQTYSPVYERAEDPTLAEEFLPTDTQTQNKIFRNIIMYDPVAGPATEYWRDLAFSRYLRLGGIEDNKILQFYEDAIEASGIAGKMPWLLNDYLTFGRVVAHFVMDDRAGYWNQVVLQDPDFAEIIVSPFPAEDPVINIQPNNEHRDWAVSRDPRIMEQREKYDPEVIKLMAHGEPYPLPSEHTLFMPRRAYGTDEYGTSYLTRIIPFKIMEKALIDSEIQAARRRAGPVWVITVPDDYEADQIQEIVDQFFAIEEDAVGGKVAVREGVNITALGGGKADFWTLSDEYDFLKTAKMNALGISESFLSGESNYSSMEKVLHVFLEKLRAIRNHFTETVITNKMLKTLARSKGFYNKPSTQVAHHYRIARREINDSDLIIPTVEWDKPLEPQADLDYWDLLERLETKGIVVPKRKWAQAAGYDFNETFENAETELEDRAKMYELKAALAKQAEEAGFDMDGEYQGEGAIGGGGPGLGDEGLGEGGGFDFDMGEGLGEGGGFGGEEGGGLELEAPPETPELPVPEAGGEEGAGADTEKARFKIDRQTPHFRAAAKQARDRWNPYYQDIEKTLGKINIWDRYQFTVGMSKRRVAQMVDEIAHKPIYDRNPMTLTRFLRRHGLNNIQSGVVQYCAARLGYVPQPYLDEESLHYMQRLLVDKANEQGLTNAINHEMDMLHRVAQTRTKAPVAGFRYRKSSGGKEKAISSVNEQLPDDQLLSGVV